MGYTHYWNLDTSKVTQDEVSHAVAAVAVFIERAFPSNVEVAGIKLADGFGEGTPEFGDGHFSLNGGDGDDFETFMFPCGGSLAEAITRGQDVSYGRAADGIAFDFCKTGRRKYDLIVCAALSILKDVLPDGAFVVSTDGGAAAFNAGAMLAGTVLKRPMRNPIDDAVFCVDAVYSEWPTDTIVFGATPACMDRARVIAKTCEVARSVR